MWKRLLLGLLLVFLFLSSAAYADVVLSDEQAMELEETLDELDATLKTQQQTLDEQQIVIDRQQTTIEEQANLIEQQQSRTDELKALLDERETSSILRLIVTAISSLAVGLLIGLLL